MLMQLPRFKWQYNDFNLILIWQFLTGTFEKLLKYRILRTILKKGEFVLNLQVRACRWHFVTSLTLQNSNARSFQLSSVEYEAVVRVFKARSNLL